MNAPWKVEKYVTAISFKIQFYTKIILEYARNKKTTTFIFVMFQVYCTEKEFVIVIGFVLCGVQSCKKLTSSMKLRN